MREGFVVSLFGGGGGGGGFFRASSLALLAFSVEIDWSLFMPLLSAKAGAVQIAKARQATISLCMYISRSLSSRLLLRSQVGWFGGRGFYGSHMLNDPFFTFLVRRFDCCSRFEHHVVRRRRRWWLLLF